MNERPDLTDAIHAAAKAYVESIDGLAWDPLTPFDQYAVRDMLRPAVIAAYDVLAPMVRARERREHQGTANLDLPGGGT